MHTIKKKNKFHFINTFFGATTVMSIDVVGKCATIHVFDVAGEKNVNYIDKNIIKHVSLILSTLTGE